ncbi:hypothetical protein ACLB2K_012958 [Fragaria x ananassa]
MSYKVDPSHVRHQSGTFGKALAPLECRFKDDIGKVSGWRAALFEASNLAGWTLFDGKSPSFFYLGTRSGHPPSLSDVGTLSVYHRRRAQPTPDRVLAPSAPRRPPPRQQQTSRPDITSQVLEFADPDSP